MLICNHGKFKGNKIYCDISDNFCIHVRYCSISMKYFQTDNAFKCLLKEKNDEKQTDAHDQH